MKEKFIRFMQGRYGVDTLNTHVLYLVIFLLIINIFINNTVVMIIGYLLWFWLLFRMLSRNISKRYAENQKYLDLIHPIQRFFSIQKKRMNDRQNKYFRCPSCKQMVRVPRGKGKVVVTCPKCHHRFEKRT